MAANSTFNGWTAFRVACLVGGLGLGSAAYLAPDWVAQFISVDLASTLALVLLLMLPATMVFQLGGSRITRAVRKSGRRAQVQKARDALPDWAERHGLAFRPDDQPDEVGTVMGEYEGFKVLVDPDAGDISARWNADLGSQRLDVSTTPAPEGEPDGLTAFDTGDEAFDDAFATRFASDDIAARLTERADARAALVAFWDAHRAQLESIGVDEHGVVCFLDEQAQYQVDAIVAVLGDLVGVLRTVEPELRASSPDEV